MNNNELTYNQLDVSDLIPYKWCSIDSSNIEDPEICFKLKVWKKQCEFGKQVLSYIKKLNYGTVSNNCLQKLLNNKYELEFLNSVDPKEMFKEDNKVPVNTPEFTMFGIDNQPQFVEVGATISGNKLFVWNINDNGSTIVGVDIIDDTNSQILAPQVTDDGQETINLSPITLGNLGDTHSWRAEANVLNSSQIVSSLFIVKTDYMRYFGTTNSFPTNLNDGAANRLYALNLQNEFNGSSNTFQFQTGTTSTKFVILIPATESISSIIDQMNMNLDITHHYTEDSIIINDANGNNVNYKMYSLSIGGPYNVNTNHVITLN